MLFPVQDKLIFPLIMTGWVNGNLYQPTKEVAGVLPIPAEICLKTGMGPYIPSLHAKQPHHFLPYVQGTQKPVLPIHNQEEHDLFCKLISNDTGFSDPVSGPNWDLAIQLWNNQADTVSTKISYKVS